MHAYKNDTHVYYSELSVILQEESHTIGLLSIQTDKYEMSQQTEQNL